MKSTAARVLVLAVVLICGGCSSADGQAAEGRAVLRSESAGPVVQSTTVSQAAPVPEELSYTGGLSEGREGDTDPDRPRLPVDAGLEFPEGTCYHAPLPGADVEEVLCGRPHTIEVFASRNLPGSIGADFPNELEASRICTEAFSEKTGVGLGLATVLDASVLSPSRASWAAGERAVTCSVIYPEPITRLLADVDPLRDFGLVSLYGLRAGDCLVDFARTLDRFPLVDCAQPHDAEVFVSHWLPAGAYPGVEAIIPVADDLCFGQGFLDFVGRDYRTSLIEALQITPTAETWALGHTRINCIATDGLVRSGSLSGVAR